MLLSTHIYIFLFIASKSWLGKMDSRGVHLPRASLPFLPTTGVYASCDIRVTSSVRLTSVMFPVSSKWMIHRSFCIVYSYMAFTYTISNNCARCFHPWRLRMSQSESAHGPVSVWFQMAARHQLLTPVAQNKWFLKHMLLSTHIHILHSLRVKAELVRWIYKVCIWPERVCVFASLSSYLWC